MLGKIEVTAELQHQVFADGVMRTETRRSRWGVSFSSRFLFWKGLLAPNYVAAPASAISSQSRASRFRARRRFMVRLRHGAAPRFGSGLLPLRSVAEEGDRPSHPGDLPRMRISIHKWVGPTCAGGRGGARPTRPTLGLFELRRSPPPCSAWVPFPTQGTRKAERQRCSPLCNWPRRRAAAWAVVWLVAPPKPGPQPAAGEGALEPQVAALRLGSSSTASPGLRLDLDPHRLSSDPLRFMSLTMLAPGAQRRPRPPP